MAHSILAPAPKVQWIGPVRYDRRKRADAPWQCLWRRGVGARATAKDFLVVQTEGKRQVRRNLKYYNLDAINSVGYRVHSKRAVR